MDSDFRIQEDRTLSGLLAWGAGASEGTRRGRTDAIQLSNSYQLDWKDYSEVGNAKDMKFRYTTVQVFN